MSEDSRGPVEQNSESCTGQTLTPQGQIEVILVEYSIREDEKNGTATGVRHIITIAAAVLAGVLALVYQGGPGQLLVLLPAILLFFMSMESDREFSVAYHVMYLSLLEERVNKLAGKPLLLWERYGSSYATIIRKLRIEYPAKNRHVTNLNYVVKVGYLVGAMSLFGLALVEGSRWLAANLKSSQICNSVIRVAYGAGHILLLGFLVFNRVVQQPRLLSLVEDKLRDEVFKVEECI